MRRCFFILASLLAVFVSVASVSLPAAVAQPRGETAQPPLPVHRMKQLWRDVDQLNFEIDQIQVYERYCKPPNGPNIADTQWEIDFARSKYNSLQREFDAMNAAFENAIKSRMTSSFRSSFPQLNGMTADNRDYWATVSGMVRALGHRLDTLQKALDGRKEQDCTKSNRQPPPPPPPPPVDWLKGLERPVAAPVSAAELPPHFCTELEKTRWILDHLDPQRIQAAENARFASYYVVDVGRRMRELETKGISGPLTADEQRGLKELGAEYKWAQDNLAEQDRIAAEINAHYAAAQKIPVVECAQRPQTGVETIKQPNYELFVYPALPPRFCSREQKDGTLGHLKFALGVAERNYDMANAKVSEIADRIAKGDNSKATSDAFQTASNAASSYHRTIEYLDAEIKKGEAMPVETCGKQGAETIRSDQAVGTVRTPMAEDALPVETKEDRKRRGTPVVIDPPKDLQTPPPPPAGTSSQSYVEPKDQRPVIAVGAGYVERDYPEQFIGRVVVGGGDFAMIYTPGTLDGFYGEIEGEVPFDNAPFWGVRSSFDFRFRYSDVEGDAFRDIAADPAVTTGFVWIDPLDSTIPFAVGLGGANLAWEAHASSSSIDAAATALYVEYRNFGPGLTGSLGVGAEIDFRETEHRTYIENLDFVGFGVYENYDFSTVAFGPRFEAGLDWDCEDDDPRPGGFYGRIRAHVSPQYVWRDIEVTQRAMGPPALLGGFDHSQRVEFDDDGFNLRYGVNAEVGFRFDERTTVFLKAGWQGDTDAPTIIPADGSAAPGVPIRADTEDASEWFVGAGLRVQFDF